MRYGMIIGVLLVAATALNAQTTVFEETLAEPPGEAWSNRAVEKTPAHGKPMLGRFGKERVTLSLKALPDHAWVRVRFDLHICGSWDGDDTQWGPDTFKLTTGDGRTLIDTTFSHAWAQSFTQGKGQSWPGVVDVHRFEPRTGAEKVNTLGYRHKKKPADSTYAVDVLLPHTGDALALHFDGAPDEAIGNEFWGLSNVKVTAGTQPPDGADADMDKTWRALSQRLPGRAVWHAVAANERFVEHVEAAIAQDQLTRPIAWPARQPHTISLMRDKDDEGQFELLSSPEQRLAHTVARVLRIIGTDRARAALDRLEKLDAKGQDTLRTMTVRVIDRQTKQPMPGVKVSFRGGCYNYAPTTTDAEGRAVLRIVGPMPSYVGSVCKAKGKINQRVRWMKITEDNPLPETFTYEMAGGTRIGGRVVNEQQDPIAGAKVTVSVRLPQTPREDGAAYPDVRELIAKTGRDGRWAVDTAPAEFDNAWLRLSHKRYIDDDIYGQSGTHKPKALREMTAVSVMKQGLTLAGRVLDAAGKPLAGAKVKQGRDRWGSNYPSAVTDSAGRFVFENTRPGPTVLTVQAKGHAPDLKRFTMTDKSGPVEFKLEKPKTIRFRVVDEQGRPFEGATVVADTWRGCRSIDWRGASDANGEVVWTGAPGDVIAYDVIARQRMSVRGRAISAGGDEPVELVMRPLLKVSGTVVDAETGEAIDKFKLMQGIDWDDIQPTHWEYHSVKEQAGGKFETTFSYPRHGHRVRIEADGYAPFLSERFTVEGGPQQLTVALHKAANVEGVVVDADGRAVEGVAVFVATASQAPYIENGRARRHDRLPMSKTDATGRYTFPPQAEDYMLVAVDEQAGYAKVPADELADDGRIELSPWATVSGVVKVGTKPAVRVGVDAHWNEQVDHGKPRVYFNNQTTTDEQGRYKIEHVLAGKGSVTMRVPTGANRYSFTGHEKYTIAPGEALTVNIGGKGRPVIGRVIVPESVDVHGYAYGSHSMSTRIDQEPFPQPEGWEEMDIDAKKAWYQQWNESEEGKAWAKRNTEEQQKRRHYPIQVAADGTFVAQGVVPGTYNLQITFSAPPATNVCGYGDPLAMVKHQVVVGPIPGGVSDEPQDIGDLELVAIKQLNVGDEVPQLECETLDGKALDLADYRGKYVLLDFWATWCGPCVGETPNLRRAYERFGGDERFAMIALSLDQKPETPRKYAEKHGLKWVQGYLGPWDQTDVPDRFAVRGIPQIMLIGPDGKVVAKNLRGNQIARAIEAALASAGG